MAMKMHSAGKPYLNYVLKDLPAFLAKAADEFGAINGCGARRHAIYRIMETHPVMVRLIEAQRTEAKIQAVRDRNKAYKVGV